MYIESLTDSFITLYKFVFFQTGCFVSFVRRRKKTNIRAMTNSTLKLIDRVERQGSPTTGSQRCSQRYGLIRTTTFFPSGARPKGSPGRLSCSPPFSSRSMRSSPIRYDSPSGSPTNIFYAGAKFSEPPSPASLPQPPSHWMDLLDTCHSSGHSFSSINDHLQMFLNVQA